MPMTAAANTTRMAMKACQERLLASVSEILGAKTAPMATPPRNPAKDRTPMMKPWR
jgi:hypothetical protein